MPLQNDPPPPVPDPAPTVPDIGPDISPVPEGEDPMLVPEPLPEPDARGPRAPEAV